MAAFTALGQSETTGAAPAHPLASKEEMIRDRFQRFQDRLFGLQEQLREAEPDNAARLGRTLERAGELGLASELERIVQLLRKSSAVSEASDAQAKWIADADRLLSILLERDSDNDEREQEIDRLQGYKEELDRLLGEERGLREASGKASAAEQMKRDLEGAIQRIEAASQSQAELSRAAQRGAGESQAKELAKKQTDLGAETGKLGEDIDRLADGKSGEAKEAKMPAAAGEHAAAAAKAAQDAADAMSAAGREMEKGNQGAAQTQQKEAEESLRRARDRLEKAKQELEKQCRLGSDAAKEQRSTGEKTRGLADKMRQDAKSQQGQGGKGKNAPGQSNPAPGAENLDQAGEHMDDAAESLEQSKPDEAGEQQDRAIDQLDQALRELEDSLQQLRKEEREEILRDLEDRFRDMLSKQRPINDATLALHQRGEANFGRSEKLELADLTAEERALSQQAAVCVHILSEEGTTIAFPRIVEQIEEDMSASADRLTALSVGPLTQGLQRDIVDALEQLLEAVKKMQQENEQQDPSQQGQNGPQPLLPTSAELKLLRSSQVRVNTRTAAIEAEREAATESSEVIERSLQATAVRQSQCAHIAKEIRDRKHQP